MDLEAGKVLLVRKAELLDQLAANTEKQSRFIQRRKTRELPRLVKEQETLLRRLAALNEQLAADSHWRQLPSLTSMVTEIEDKQQQLLMRNRQLLLEAETEKSKIAAELKGHRTARRLQSSYSDHWLVLAAGHYFNARR